MDDDERYADAVCRLAKYHYAVFPDEHGYLVCHLTDHDDVTRDRTLAELIEHANLVEWAASQGLIESPK